MIPVTPEVLRRTLINSKVKVPATTLDALASELALKPPFLLKLDVQGAERSALAGARNVLADSLAVICEADMDDFQDVTELLVEAGFVFYDITQLSRLQDGTLAWFYPIYVKASLDHVRLHALWDQKDNDSVIRLQEERRSNILKSNSEMLNRLRHRDKNVGRNEPCPCGSGRKFKHCCGGYGA